MMIPILQAFSLVLVSFTFFSHLAAAQSLKVGMTSKTLFYLPFYAGQKKNFYSAENLKVELILIGRSDVQLQAVTLEGLKANIEVQFRDGVLKEPLPLPERYADQSFLRQAQKELGL